MLLSLQLRRPGRGRPCKLGNLQKVVNLLGQVQEFQLSALVANRSKRTDQFADTRAVNVVDVAQI